MVVPALLFVSLSLARTAPRSADVDSNEEGYCLLEAGWLWWSEAGQGVWTLGEEVPGRWIGCVPGGVLVSGQAGILHVEREPSSDEEAPALVLPGDFRILRSGHHVLAFGCQHDKVWNKVFLPPRVVGEDLRGQVLLADESAPSDWKLLSEWRGSLALAVAVDPQTRQIHVMRGDGTLWSASVDFPKRMILGEWSEGPALSRRTFPVLGPWSMVERGELLVGGRDPGGKVEPVAFRLHGESWRDESADWQDEGKHDPRFLVAPVTFECGGVTLLRCIEKGWQVPGRVEAHVGEDWEFVAEVEGGVTEMKATNECVLILGRDRKLYEWSREGLVLRVQ